MALNSASHNPTAEPTGSVTGPPPPVTGQTAKAVQDAALGDATGQKIAGVDRHNNDADQTVMGESGKEKIAQELDKGPKQD